MYWSIHLRGHLSSKKVLSMRTRFHHQLNLIYLYLYLFLHFPGFIRDVTGSYDIAYRLTGSFLILCVFLHVFASTIREKCCNVSKESTVIWKYIRSPIQLCWTPKNSFINTSFLGTPWEVTSMAILQKVLTWVRSSECSEWSRSID